MPSQSRVAPALGPNPPWSDFNNLQSSDDVWCSTNIPFGGGSRTLSIPQWGFTIPSGATVNGIEVSYEHSGGIPPAVPVTVTACTLTHPTLGPSSDLETGSVELLQNPDDTTYSKGGPTELWGLTWTPANINHNDFATNILYEALDAAGVTVDLASCTVYYTGGDPGPMTSTNKFLPLLGTG